MTPDKTEELDYLIIGAGPAGLQLGYFLQRAGCDYLVLDAEETAGSFYRKFPRHRKLISINKTYTGYADGQEVRLRYDWNSLISDEQAEMSVGRYTRRYFPDAGDYVRYLQDYADHFALNIRYGTRVTGISKDDLFCARDNNGKTWRSRCLVVATGTHLPYIPEVPGIELAEHYVDFSLDAEDYADQRVLILGKGNSAFETADHLTETAQVIHLCSPHPVELAWKTHFLGDLRAVNNNFMDTYILKGQNSVLDADIDLIERVDGEYRVHVTFTHAGGQRGILAYDRVLSCTGFRFDDAIFDENCKPEMVIRNKLPAMTSSWESTNVKDLYFAGTVMQMRDFHKTTSNVIHGFRFNVKALSEMLGLQFAGTPLPYSDLPLDPEAITGHVIERVSTGAAIFLQPGFLCDVLVIPESGDAARYYQGLPVDYVHDGELGKNSHYYLVTMEYGDIEGDPFRVERDPDPEKAYLDVYLHPIVRRYSGSVSLSEHHIPEHLENDWRPNQHPGERPLMRSWEYPGETDPTEFQQVFSRNLLAWFTGELEGTP